MAQSQVPFTYINKGQGISSNLSSERFSTYLKKSNFNYEYAFELYLYNARLAKSFLFPLQILEVSLRNAINHLLITKFGEDWPHNEIFKALLNYFSLASLNDGIKRANTRQNCDVVSTLSFDFWSNLFRDDYDRSLWQTNIHKIFPDTSLTRKKIQKELKELNKLRNRIAHHEPILNLNLSDLYTRILNILDLLSSDTRQWVQHFGTVNEMLRTKPSASGNKKPHFSERCDTDFCTVNLKTLLSEIPNNNFLVCQEDKKNLCILEKSDISNYVFSLVNSNKELIVDLKDYSINHIIEEKKVNYQVCHGTESLSISQTIFRNKGIKYILVLQEESILGIICKAHRNY